MDSSDEEVLLESYCFLLNHHQEQIKRKWKRTRVREIFKKRIEQGVCHNLLQQMRVNEREPYSSSLYNELFSKSDEEKCTAFQSMAWSLTVHKNAIKN